MRYSESLKKNQKGHVFSRELKNSDPNDDYYTPLVECGLGRGLVDHVLRGEVDVVASPHGVQEARLVHLHVLRGQDRQQGLKDGQIDRKIYRYKIDR